MTLRTALSSGLVAGAIGAAVLVLAGPQPAQAVQSRGDQAAVARSFQSSSNGIPVRTSCAAMPG